MKRPFWIVGLLLVCAGLVLFGILMYRSIFTDKEDMQVIGEQKTFSAAELKSIQINSVSADIEATSYDGDQVQVELKGKANRHVTLWTEEKGSSLRIEVKEKSRSFLSFFNFSGEGLTLIVKIPERSFESLSIESVSGEQLLSGLYADEVKVETVSGDIDLEKSTGVLTIKSVSGEQHLAALQGDSLSAETTSGDVELSGSELAKGKVKTVSGEVKLKEVTGEFQVKTTSGDVNLGLLAMNPAKVETVSGEIEIRIPKESSFEVQGETVTGSIHVKTENFQFEDSSKGNYKGKAGNGDALLKLATVSGDIQVSE
ncbi:DUF4097 domain-containing protein [Gorillibacterium sp. CAU 1737]|uniref:DUF4097 domain-containing protein n=1 Tax=Gorillibacterium sp. CAU 1737 TaxID=3140362 RepID=UPI003261D19A